MNVEVKDGIARWNVVVSKVFASEIPQSREWIRKWNIINILKQLGSVDDTNIIFTPHGGALSLSGAANSYEPDCIELHVDKNVSIIKPKRLKFYGFNGDPLWFCFRLETGKLRPSGADERVSNSIEELTEVSPGEYAKFGVKENGSYGTEESGRPIPLPQGARTVTRYLEGTFLLVAKYSLYNSPKGALLGPDLTHRPEGSFVKQVERLIRG